MKRYILLFLLSVLPVFAYSQVTVSGYVTDANDGEPLFGANVVLDGTTQGASRTL